MEYAGKCPYCHLIFDDEYRLAEHRKKCDKYLPFRVEITKEFNGNVADVQYHFKPGEVSEVNFDIYRILRGLDACRRL